jgi:rod shape-determining protein MreC
MRLIWWLATVVVISLISIFISERRGLDPVQNLSLTMTSPLTTVLRDATRSADDLFKGITDRGDLTRENRELKEQVEALQQQLAQRQDAEQRVRELEEALGATQARPEDQLLAANVIAEDTSGLKRMIAIDLGSADGLDEGMVVLSRSGSLVGTVSRAFDDFAWVRLITDPESSVNAQVNHPAPSPAPTPPPDVLVPSTPAPAPQASPGASATPAPAPAPVPTPPPPPPPTRGIAEGDLREGVVLGLVPSDVQIAQGSLVTTSGLGGNFPSALLIGSIDGVERRPQNPFTTASVEPAANLAALDTVLVLISFQPARLNDQ